MDEELKRLVEQVESCFPEKTTNSEVINVATILLVKTAIQLVENVQTDKVTKELESVLSHVIGNIAANVKIALMRKRFNADLGIFRQMVEGHESNAN